MAYRAERLAAGLLAGLCLAEAALAADFEQSIDLPAGSKIDLTIERSRGDGVAPAMTIGFRYRQEITPTADGYSVRQVFKEMTVPESVSPAERAALDQGLAATSDITFTTDDSLAPIRLVGWEALIDRIIESMKTSPGAPAAKAAEAARESFLKMTPEVAAAVLLREQAMLAAPQNTSLSLGKPISAKSPVPNPLGGPPIDSIESIELESLDRTAGKAVIVRLQALDAESAGRSIRQVLEAMVARMPEASRPTAAQLDSLKMERTLVCRSDMDLATGLAARTDCTSTTTAFDASLNNRTRVDRWVITQALVAS